MYITSSYMHTYIHTSHIHIYLERFLDWVHMSIYSSASVLVNVKLSIDRMNMNPAVYVDRA